MPDFEGLDPNNPTLQRVIAVSNSELETFTAARKKRLFELYMRERDALVGKLLAMADQEATFGSRQAAVALEAIDDALRRLGDDLGLELDDAITRTGERGLDDGIREAGQLEGALGSAANARAIASLTGKIPHRAIDQVRELVSLDAGGYTVELGNAAKQIITQGLLQGKSSRQLAPELARRLGEAFDGKAWRLERTLRTGLNAAVNRGHNEGLLEVRDQVLPELKRQGHEFIMTPAIARERSRVAGYRRRNHPFSAYLDGKVAEIDQPWTVASPVFPVMFWTREGGAYVGMHYPAHLEERGKQVPFHPAWAGARSKEAGREQRAAEARQRTEEAIARREAKRNAPPAPVVQVTPPPAPPAPAAAPAALKKRPDGATVRAKLEARGAKREALIDKLKAQEDVFRAKKGAIYARYDQEAIAPGSDLDIELEGQLNRLHVQHRRIQARRFKVEDLGTAGARELLYSPNGAAKLQVEIRDLAPGLVPQHVADNHAKVMRDGHEAFAKLLGPGHTGMEGAPYVMRGFPKGTKGSDRYRSHHIGGSYRLVEIGDHAPAQVVVHELAHALEQQDGHQDAMAAFVERRATGKPQSMRSLTGNKAYDAGEFAYPDKFYNPYVGKLYYTQEARGPRNVRTYNLPSPGATVRSTEVLSMGLERMWADPAGFAKEDPEYFDLVWDVIRGKE